MGILRYLIVRLAFYAVLTHFLDRNKKNLQFPWRGIFIVKLLNGDCFLWNAQIGRVYAKYNSNGVKNCYKSI